MSQNILQTIQAMREDYADSEEMALELFERRAAFLIPLRHEHASLQAATLDRYISAFDALELAILLCRSVAEILERRRSWLCENEFWGRLALDDIFQTGT